MVALSNVQAGKTGEDDLSFSGPVEEQTGDPLNGAGHRHGTTSACLAEAAPGTAPELVTRVPHFAALVRYEPAGDDNFFDLLPEGGLLPPNRRT